ncbi:hypothetical protein TNCV_1842771 [Trichonephila clavipes]|nr:hypothetical protein TNCV_1842771 [Trichonephila clavipes]
MAFTSANDVKSSNTMRRHATPYHHFCQTFLTTQSDKSDTSEPVSSLRGARKSQKGLGKQAATGTPKQKEEAD